MSRRKGSPKTGGRKKGSKNKRTIKQELALEFLRKKIRKHWEELIVTKIELAKGIWIEKKLREGEVRVYKEKPDSNSLEYLFGMVVGKPKESVEVLGEIKLGKMLTEEERKLLKDTMEMDYGKIDKNSTSNDESRKSKTTLGEDKQQ